MHIHGVRSIDPNKTLHVRLSWPSPDSRGGAPRRDHPQAGPLYRTDLGFHPLQMRTPANYFAADLLRGGASQAIS